MREHDLLLRMVRALEAENAELREKNRRMREQLDDAQRELAELCWDDSDELLGSACTDRSCGGCGRCSN